jgi:propionyl-CoA synthetase
VGWVVGHSYIAYAPLLAGCTTVVYEGKPIGTPDAGAYWRVIEEYGVTTFFTAPTGFRAVKREDPDGTLFHQYDTSSLRHLFLAGERLDPETYHWANDLLGVPIVDHWWQTETGWPIAANLRGIEKMDIKPGSPSVPVPGFEIHITDENGTILPAGHEGFIMIKLPLPPGVMNRVWGDDAKFTDTYLTQLPGYYLTGDGGFFDDDGYLFVMGRIDDVINVAGHRMSTGEIEEVVAEHPDVAECAVIGVVDKLKGHVPRALVVVKAGVTHEHEEISRQVVQLVRDRLGAVTSLKQVDVVKALPKTRSGKVLRKNMRAIADGVDIPVPSTIDNPQILEDLRAVLHP